MPIDESTSPIVEAVHRVRGEIATLARRAGRAPDTVRLVAVSKTHGAERVAAALAAGQTAFGENTMQEAMTKIPVFAGRGLEWHFIGHLQSNKAKFLPGHFAWWHSLDSIALAQRVARYARAAGTSLQTLIEVNVSAEPSKHGVAPPSLYGLVESLLQANLTALSLRGLMAIAPNSADEGPRQRAFAYLRELLEGCQTRFGLHGFNELSMGMSDDYRAAIQEGATLVRLGSAIFGAREKR